MLNVTLDLPRWEQQADEQLEQFISRTTGLSQCHYLEDTLPKRYTAVLQAILPCLPAYIFRMVHVVYHQSNGESGQIRTDVPRLKVKC